MTIDIANLDDLIDRYLAGASVQEIAADLPVSDRTLLRRFRARGIEIRQGPSYRTSDPMAVRAKRARTRELRCIHDSAHERTFSEWLTERGWGFTPQKAIGSYNVDLALTEVPVAVEVSGGGGNARRESRRRERTEYLLDEGWTVVEVILRTKKPMKREGWSGGRAHPLLPASADYVVAVAQELRGKPPARGQHWMVWADGQPYAARSRQIH